MKQNVVFIGVKAHVSAVDSTTGNTLWQTKLKGGLTSGDPFVSLLVEDNRVYAHSYGELFCLDAQTGSILWKNSLSGLGYGIASLATEGSRSGNVPGVVYGQARQRNSTPVTS